MKRFASQFVSKSPLAKLKGKQDSIQPITKSMKDAAKLGGAGAIGIIGGAAGAGAKAGARAAKALGNDAKAGITITKPNPGGIKGTGASRTGKGKIHDLVTGGRSMKGMKSYKGGR
jgi:fatty acid-binding protein DegV